MKTDIEKWFLKELILAAKGLVMVTLVAVAVVFCIEKSESNRDALLWIVYWVLIFIWYSAYTISRDIAALKRSVEKNEN